MVPSIEILCAGCSVEQAAISHLMWVGNTALFIVLEETLRRYGRLANGRKLSEWNRLCPCASVLDCESRTGTRSLTKSDVSLQIGRRAGGRGGKRPRVRPHRRSVLASPQIFLMIPKVEGVYSRSDGQTAVHVHNHDQSIWATCGSENQGTIRPSLSPRTQRGPVHRRPGPVDERFAGLVDVRNTTKLAAWQFTFSRVSGRSLR